MLSFHVGEADRPRGHALLFFRDPSDPSVVWATYLVVLPVEMDFARYLPAALAQHLGGLTAGASLSGPAAFPMPPIPEKVEGGLEAIERLASLRDDDVLDGGTLARGDPFQVVQPVADLGAEYARAYHARLESAPRASEPPLRGGAAASLPGVDVDELLLQVMPDREKIGRLARLVGTLRYAVEGGDEALTRETVADMERIGRHLGEKYRVAEVVAAARVREARGGVLAQLLVERCYRLVDEDYGSLAELDRRIASLQEGAEEQATGEP